MVALYATDMFIVSLLKKPATCAEGHTVAATMGELAQTQAQTQAQTCAMRHGHMFAGAKPPWKITKPDLPDLLPTNSI